MTEQTDQILEVGGKLAGVTSEVRESKAVSRKTTQDAASRLKKLQEAMQLLSIQRGKAQLSDAKLILENPLSPFSEVMKAAIVLYRHTSNLLLSPRYLSKKSGIHRNNIKQIIDGTRNPTFDERRALAGAVNTLFELAHIDYLIL